MAGGSGTQNQGQTPAASNPLGPQQGQMPSFANNPFGPPQNQGPGTQNQFGGGFGGQQPAMLSDMQSDMQYRPERQQPFGGQQFGQQPSNLMTPRQFFDGGFKDTRFNPSQPQQQNPFSQLPPKPQEESKVPDWVQAPDPGMATGQAFTELTNPTTGEKFMAPSTGYSVRGQQQTQQPQQPFGAQVPHTGGQRRNEVFDQFARAGRLDEYYRRMQDLQNSANQTARPMQQPGRPAFEQSPEFQGYQTQMRGLQQQMDEYVKKAPMYQQLQDLQGKMQGYQQRQQQAMQQQMMQRQSPFRQNPYQRQFGGGIQGLMGMLGGRGGMPQYQRAMTMDMPQYQGRSFDLPTNFMKNGGKV